MPRHRNDRRADEEPRGALDERRRLLAAAFLFGAVIVVLALGALLRSGDDPVTDASGPTVATLPLSEVADVEAPPLPDAPSPVETAPIRREPQTKAAPPAAPPPARAASLDGRAGADPARLRGSGGTWTVQLIFACDPETVRRVLELTGHADEVYVLPAEHEGRPCYRVCWGSYSEREAADSHSDLPRSLKNEHQDRLVRAILDIAS